MGLLINLTHLNNYIIIALNYKEEVSNELGKKTRPCRGK